METQKSRVGLKDVSGRERWDFKDPDDLIGKSRDLIVGNQVWGVLKIFKAFDKHLNKRVVIKIIEVDPYFKDIASELLEDFSEEASIMGDLSGDGSVVVYDYVQNEKSAYYVMQDLSIDDKHLLKDLLESKKDKVNPQEFPIQKKLFLMHNLSKLVSRFHRKGIYHLDLKPENIGLVGDYPVFFDFGIHANKKKPISLSVSSPGTIKYTSPERAMGKTLSQIDLLKSEVFSLALIYFELLFKESLIKSFGIENLILEHANLADSINSIIDNSPEDYGVAVKEQLKEIFKKALAIKPDDRMEDPIHLSTEIANAIEMKSINATKS